MSLNIAQKIDQAWRLRFDQRNEESLALWREVREEIGIGRKPLSSEDIPRLLEQEHSDLIFESIFLHASLCRMQKQFAESNRLLTVVTDQFETMGIPLPARCLIEKGLNCLANGDFSNALELFLTASSRAGEPFQKITSLTNVVGCLDELGLSFERPLQEAKRMIGERAEELGVAGAARYLEHVEMRHAFRRGSMAQIFKKEISPVVNQTTYFRMWIAALPYHSCYEDPHHQLERFANAQEQSFYKSYRLRTMQGLLHPDDLQMFKPSEWADRLYLWVWRWLKDPEGFSLRRLMTVLSQWTGDPTIASRLNTEDRQLVRNALLWLSLFDRQSRTKLKDVLASLVVSDGAASTLLSFESLLIYYFMALRDGETDLAADYLKNLELSPLWQDGDLCFRCLARLAIDDDQVENLPERLKILGRNVRSLTRPEKENPKSYFVIDMSTYEIRDRRTDKILISESIAKASYLLSRNTTVPVTDIVESCFGISRFDASIHNQRVFNLLWRMKQLLGPGLQFKMKSGVVLTEGDWSRCSIIGINTASMLLRSQPEWLDLGTASLPAQKPERSQAIAAALTVDTPISAVLSRKEIEDHLGKSRATMNRILKAWEEKGWVKREGSARATKYRVGREVMKILKGTLI